MSRGNAMQVDSTTEKALTEWLNEHPQRERFCKWDEADLADLAIEFAYEWSQKQGMGEDEASNWANDPRNYVEILELINPSYSPNKGGV